MEGQFNYREIPFNYTSFSDREIVLKFFDEETWDILNTLRSQRITGRSAKLLFDILGDIFIIDRNPYIYNDFLENKKKQYKLKKLHKIRLTTIEKGADTDIVKKLIDKTREIDDNFFNSFSLEKKERKKILNDLKLITSRKNIFFSAFHKVTHVTDATDWRVEYPKVVVYPENAAEITRLIKGAKKINCSIIPRGGGTGLTGGAVPVFKNTMVVNTEKLRTIYPIEIINENDQDIPVIEVDSGVITESVMNYCKDNGYIFATDPTSAWASTIGGNIAENCGGKKAVIWGTAIDNIYSFQIVNHEGNILEIKRKNHPHRKIEPEDTVEFEVFRLLKKDKKELLQTIKLKGTDVRKKGVGKDITNKALGGVPGIQKEGGDGIIVSAKFVLYRPFNHMRTLCLEFFGKNLVNASNAIVDIRNLFKSNSLVHLTALEHFDEKYVAAISYRTKSQRSEVPKAVLLIDIESDMEQDLSKACTTVIETVKKYECEGFLAVDETARTLFWKDRKNLGAIAKHTNAFKLNEDVVIPIERLPEFADYIEKLNIEKELKNNVDIINGCLEFFRTMEDTDDSFLNLKFESFSENLNKLHSEYKSYIDNLDNPGNLNKEKSSKSTFEQIQDGNINIAIDDIHVNFRKNFRGYDELIKKFEENFFEYLNKKIIIATHMHAGDGNIHVNIPVHSNDYLMLQEADETAGIIMEKTKELDGVISGEHGIGLTKLRYIEQHNLDAYAEYKTLNDPDNMFNPGKLDANFPIHTIYTPSLNLLEKEAVILEAADLKDLTIAISACVRCGKCKEVCNTHYPKGCMMYNPRNKILGVSLITEAVLYEAETARSLTFRNFKMLRDISDHCTMCHNCYTPCPVNIDFGVVTLSIRDLLVKRNKSKFKFITSFVLFYLRLKGYKINKILRILLLKIGYTSQRIGYYFNKPVSGLTKRIVPKIGSILMSRLPKSGVKTLREKLKLKGSNLFYAFSNPNMEIKKSVVYFPGCGSERMFPDISFAVIAMLYDAGIRVVIPPEYYCCGYPLLANGKVKQAEMRSYENRVIFHRMADILGYMDIKDVLISCGTCYEMLNNYKIENIFYGSSIIDINEFMAREDLLSLEKRGEPVLYHDPCHTPLKKYGPDHVFNELLGIKPISVPNCCGEGGTLALSTPEISNLLRDRKETNISEANGNEKKLTVLTTCPSCVQGLSRIDKNLSVKGKSLIVALAEESMGKHWKRNFLKKIKEDKGYEKIVY